ncbi:winged helix-turn-helix transcriptional regulator [Natronoglycomyces albus]|uniref:Helix-turn-helix transcriptional regulator n=1 Tax=Natronoglycomyces albus TaxID=2811108 RepID=A0A895XW38_9ACTN|nr:helix-turn-helix domain-containing protein [Natronoglycomyces albus]QSB06440.1 helix-turn-helix transcriptional regulator [Natronoglycomyces albus]
MASKRDAPYVCGIDAAVDVIGGKWKVLIIWALSDGGKRFSQMRRMLDSVSEKVLGEHLRQLEADGIVERTVFAEVPPRVEYALTASGQELNEALEPLATWGSKYRSALTDTCDR